MYRTMLKSKIHRATVTQADLHYVGSVTVDEDLMEAADLLPGDAAQIPQDDRWAIVAYVRALERAQNATREDVPATLQGSIR